MLFFEMKYKIIFLSEIFGLKSAFFNKKVGIFWNGFKACLQKLPREFSLIFFSMEIVGTY